MSARIQYSADYLKSLQRHDLSLPRNTRKSLFEFRIWRPASERYNGIITEDIQSEQHSSPVSISFHCSPKVRSTVSKILEAHVGLPIPTQIGLKNVTHHGCHQLGVNSKSLITVQCLKWNFPVILNTNPTSIANKFDEFEVVLKQNNVDFACITESWFQDKLPDDPFTISGYHPPLRRDRVGRLGGGVLLYVRDNLIAKRINDLEESDLETMWLTIIPRRLPREYSILVIGAIYHTPKPTPDSPMLQHIYKSLDTLLQKHWGF